MYVVEPCQISSFNIFSDLFRLYNPKYFENEFRLYNLNQPRMDCGVTNKVWMVCGV